MRYNSCDMTNREYKVCKVTFALFFIMKEKEWNYESNGNCKKD